MGRHIPNNRAQHRCRGLPYRSGACRLVERDTRYWIEHKTFPPDEIAIRFHHRLVAIHPFPSGNGRHARLAADFLIERLGGERFSWGGGSLGDVGELRAQYVATLRAADKHDIAPLMEFART